VAPISKIPTVIGDLGEKINITSKKPANGLSRFDSLRSNTLFPIEIRGIEEVVLAKVDSITRAMYYAFKASVNEKHFFDSSGTSADELFNQLILISELQPLHGMMRRNYAAALQDMAQQALNALLADDPFEFNNWYFNPEKYIEYPKYLERAIQLIGKDHNSFSFLYAQQKYFEAYNLLKFKLADETDKLKQDSFRQFIKTLLVTALEYSPDAAYIYHALGNLYWNKNNYSSDSLIRYCKIAIELAPNWIAPYHVLADEYISTLVDIYSAENLIKKGLKIKPDSYLLNLLMAWLLQKTARWNEADSICLKLIKKRPDLFNSWSTMVQSNAELQDWKKVIEYSNKSLQIEPGERNWAWGWYIKALLMTNDVKKAKQILTTKPDIYKHHSALINSILADYYLLRENWIATDSLNHVVISSGQSSLNMIADAFVRQCIILLNKGLINEAESLFIKAINTDPTPDAADHIARCWLAKIESIKGNNILADSLFKQSFKYPKNIKWAHEIGFCMYGDFLVEQNRYAEAIIQFNKSIDLIPLGYLPYYGLAKCYAKKGDQKSTLDFLEKALDRYYPISKPIYREPLFKQVRNSKRFQKLMNKYFPGFEN
jgi:Tfp pilus assembly protein PilF